MKLRIGVLERECRRKKGREVTGNSNIEPDSASTNDFFLFLFLLSFSRYLNCSLSLSLSPSLKQSGADGEAVDERAPSMGAKSLCIPFEQDKYPDIKGLKCPQCGKDAKRWTMFGR